MNEAWAFETGVYDTSTFVQNPDRTWQDQQTRSPGAKFWIPGIDEWIKAMYFDPNKGGPGMPGYWRHPTSSDTPPVPGAPGTPGAQTNAGNFPEKLDYLWVNVGSYPDTQSPWGLLDGSGALSEWTEYNGGFPSEYRFTVGSRSSMADGYEMSEQIGVVYGVWPGVSRQGLRIASAVPSASSGITLIMCAFTLTRRRR